MWYSNNVPFLWFIPIQQAEAIKMATQLKGEVLPIRRPVSRVKARALTEAEKKYSVFGALRVARSDARLVGKREKAAKQKTEDATKMKK